MNKRQKKKFEKKLFHKTWKGYLEESIRAAIKRFWDKYPELQNNPILAITDRRGKHIEKAYSLSLYPSAIKNIKNEPNEVTLEFRSYPSIPLGFISQPGPITDSHHMFTARDMLRTWIDSLCDPSNITHYHGIETESEETE